MIVKNEEDVLERCLSSTRDLFDEIIIVDTGSTDSTIDIAKKYTNKIYNFKWIDDFSTARNFAFSKATKDYIMWLDADDIILENDYKELKKLKDNMKNDVDIYMLKYNIAFDEFDNPTFSYYRERLLKREKHYKWVDRVHEYIPLYGNIENLDIAITHKKKKTILSDRNLKIYEKMLNEGYDFSDRNNYYYGRELYDHQRYEECIKRLNIFLNDNRGWIEDNINACIIASECYNHLNNKDKCIEYLYKTFNYDRPRPKTCCLIADYFFKRKDYRKAIFWYKIVLGLPKIETQGFYQKDYDVFIPAMSLCVCYDIIGKRRKAIYYHKMCRKLKPNNPSVLANESYFFKNKKD